MNKILLKSDLTKLGMGLIITFAIILFGIGIGQATSNLTHAEWINSEWCSWYWTLAGDTPLERWQDKCSSENNTFHYGILFFWGIMWSFVLVIPLFITYIIILILHDRYFDNKRLEK